MTNDVGLKEAVVPALDPRSCFEAFLRAVTKGRPLRLTSEEPSLEEIFLAYYQDRVAVDA